MINDNECENVKFMTEARIKLNREKIPNKTEFQYDEKCIWF